MAICSACGMRLGEGALVCTRCGHAVDDAVARRVPSLTRAATAPLTADATLAVGERLGGYAIEAIAGSGGMGVVYRARELGVGRPVALKVIKPALARDRSFRERFEREARLAARIEHPNVVPVYQAGEDAGRLYIAMRYVDGIDLATLLGERGRLAPAEAVAVVTQVARALDAAHERGLVHRDVKPANVLLSGAHAYLTDFGLTVSTSAEGKLTGTGVVVGTVAYVAPEQIRGGDVDGRADVYSLAALLHHCLTGQVPFLVEHELDALAAHLASPPPRPSAIAAGVPAAFDRVVAWGMAKPPDGRPASPGALAAAAAAAARGARVSGAPRRTRPGRTRAMVVLGVVAIAASTVAVVISSSGSGPPPTRPPSRLGPAWHVSDVPEHVAVAGGWVWTKPTFGGFLQRIDPRTGSSRAIPPAADLGGGGFPDLVAGAGALWTTQSLNPSGGVTKLDPRTGGGLGRAGLAGARRVVATDDGVWATAIVRGRGTLARIDPRSVTVTAGPVGTGRRPAAVAAAGDGVWVADRSAGEVTLFDARSLRLLARVAVGRAPGDVAALDGLVWVANFGDRTLQRLDPVRRRAVGAAVSLGKEIDDIALTRAGLWVASADGTVTLLDARDGRVARPPVTVGPAPLRLAPAGNAVWVASATASTVRHLNP
jgi:serine/threonine protein kinase/DNA-binding beta-propeller fold protein YncE